MTENRSISCQVKLTEKANEKLGSFKTRLKERNIKMSKSDIINLVLTKMSTAEFEKIATSTESVADLRELRDDQGRLGRYPQTSLTRTYGGRG